MPFSPRETYAQGAGLGEALTEPFARAMQLVVARRFEELDRQRESDAAKETAATYFELTGDTENAEKLRGAKGPFPPGLERFLIERAEQKRQMDESMAMARDEAAARAAAEEAKFGRESSFEAEQNRLREAAAYQRALLSAGGGLGGAGSAGGIDWTVYNRAGVASKRTYDQFDAFLQSTDDATRRAFASIAGIDPDEINKYSGEGASKKRPALPTGSILAAFGETAKHPGRGRERLDEILGGIKDGEERGRVRASLLFARNLARQYQTSQDALERFDEGLGGLPGPFALPEDEGLDLFLSGGGPATSPTPSLPTLPMPGISGLRGTAAGLSPGLPPGGGPSFLDVLGAGASIFGPLSYADYIPASPR